MVVVKLKWELVEENDKVLLILPDICRYKNFTNPHILNAFRESVKKIKCKFVVVIIPNLIFTQRNILKYEELYDNEFQWLSNVSLLNDTTFLDYHNESVMYILQDTTSFIDTSFFSKIVINTLNCDELCIRQLKSLHIPLHYGICVFEEIINMSIFLNGTISLIIGKTEEKISKESMVDMIFNCSGKFIKNSISYEEPTICIDVFSDLIYRLDKLKTIPIFIGEFSFENSQIETRWNSYFTKKICIYDISAYETLKPIANYRLSKDIPNLLKMFYSQNSDLLHINL